MRVERKKDGTAVTQRTAKWSEMARARVAASGLDWRFGRRDGRERREALDGARPRMISIPIDENGRIFRAGIPTSERCMGIERGGEIVAAMAQVLRGYIRVGRVQGEGALSRRGARLQSRCGKVERFDGVFTGTGRERILDQTRIRKYLSGAKQRSMADSGNTHEGGGGAIEAALDWTSKPGIWRR